MRTWFIFFFSICVIGAGFSAPAIACERFPVGKSTSTSLLVGTVDLADIAADGSTVATRTLMENKQVVVTRLPALTQRSFTAPRTIPQIQLSNDGTKLLMTNGEFLNEWGGTQVFDTRTGKKNFDVFGGGDFHFKWSGAARLSPNANCVIGSSTEGFILIHDLRTGTERVVMHSGAPDAIEVSDDCTEVAAADLFSHVTYSNLKTGYEKQMDLGFKNLQLAPMEGGMRLVTQEMGGTVKVIALKTHTAEKFIDDFFSVGKAALSPDGKAFAAGSMPSPETTLFRFADSRKINIKNPAYVTQLLFTPDSKTLLAVSQDGTITVTNVGDGKTWTMPPPDPKAVALKLSADSSKLFAVDEAGVFHQIALESACVSPAPILGHADDCIECQADPVRVHGTQPLSQALRKMIDDVSQKSLCTRAFDKKAWDKLTALPKKTRLTHAELVRFLLRFQKPGGFEPALHLSILLAAINEPDTSPAFEQLVVDAMAGIRMASEPLYRDLFSRYPQLAKAANARGGHKGSCRTSSEELQVLNPMKI